MLTNSFVSKKIREINNARKKAFEKTLPKGKTYEMVVAEEVKKLEKYLIFLINYVQAISDSQKEIKAKIEKMKINTKQQLREEQLLKEIWILRYASLFMWFFCVKEPKNQAEVKENIALINRAFQSVKSVSDFLPWLKEGLLPFTEGEELKFDNLKKFKSKFPEVFAGKMATIAFECTEGRLTGEQHDSVIDLIKTTIEDDKEILGL